MNHTKNAFFETFSEADRENLRPHLKHVSFPQRKVIHEPNEVITRAIFPFDAVISVVVVLSTGETIEAAMVGHDGIIGASAAVDGRLSINRAIVQIAGQGLQCDISDLKRLAAESPTLRTAINRHQESLLVQAQQSAACNVTHVIESRLARWLLRARDLCGGDTLDLTQEFLADMLGVRRTSVSIVAHTLQQAGLINYKRGRIRILNVEDLKETACECYETVRMHYESVLNRGNE